MPHKNINNQRNQTEDRYRFKCLIDKKIIEIEKYVQ